MERFAPDLVGGLVARKPACRIPKIGGRPVDKPVGGSSLTSNFGHSEQIAQLCGSPTAFYLSEASWSGIHWSVRGVQLNRSRLA